MNAPARLPSREPKGAGRAGIGASLRAMRRRFGRLLPTLSEYAHNEVRHTRPSILVLAAASRCNATCNFCFDFKRLEPRATSLAQFETILDKLSPHLELVDFSFYGEPLLNPELPDLIRHARHRGLGTILYSNGMLLDDRRIAALADSGIEVVVLNLNAWLESYHLGDVAELPERRVEQVNRFIRACAPRTWVVLQVIAPADTAKFDRGALARRFVNPGNRLLRIKREEKFSYDGETSRRGPIRCFRPFEEIAVAPDGEVLVCCKDMLRRNSFGNLLTDDLETIWVDRMNALRRQNEAPLCLRCEAPGKAPRFIADVLFSPLGARKLYLKAGSVLFSWK